MLDIARDFNFIINSFDGLLVVDEKERIVFMGAGLLDLIGVKDLDQVKGKILREVIPTNNTYLTLETGRRQIGKTYIIGACTIISNSHPIYKNGKLIGALEYDVFESYDLLSNFFDNLQAKKEIYGQNNKINFTNRKSLSLDNIKGSSNIVRQLKKEIETAGASNSTVLVTGETGSGKELIAQSIHMSSSRWPYEFIRLNCGSIPAELFESELFGYEEGSFTGAKKGGKKGLVELADKGTLFLDEINSLPKMMQVKLLHFIQEKQIRRVGGNDPIHVDARIIAATNEPLEDLVEEGLFRKDLYYRLNVINIVSEPLRKRRDDIPELINHFIHELNISLGKDLEAFQVKGISKDALKMLMDYDWPGNVRELHNAIERAMNKCSTAMLDVKHFSDFAIMHSQNRLSSLQGLDKEDLNLKKLRENVEIYAVNELLNNRNLSFKDAADELGITRQMLYKKIRDLNISLKRYIDKD